MKLVQLSGNRSAHTMERVNIFNPSDMLWRYPMGFQTQHGPYPFLDFRTLLPNSLASDPRLWSREDVVAFLRWCEYEFDLPRFDMDVFQMNGKALCLLTKTDLNERSPGCGDVLHNVLHMLMRSRLPSSPITPHFPLTPTWNIPPAIEFPGAQNSVTLSPAPSLDSQGSPRQPDQNNQVVNNSYNSSCDTSAQRDMRHMATLSTDEHFPHDDTQSNNKNTDPKKSPVQPSNGQNGSSGSTLSDSEEEPNSPTVHNTLSSPQPQSPHNVKPQVFFPSDNISEPNTNGRLLWDFLQQLLNDPLQRYTSYIAWKNREAGVFKIVDPPGLAKLWGIQKNHLSMNYDKMSRALRYYYRVNILRKVQGERHCYQFLRNPSELKNIKHISLLRHQMNGQQTQQQMQFQQPNYPVQQPPQQQQTSMQQAPQNQPQQNIPPPPQPQMSHLKSECADEPTDLSRHANCSGNVTEVQLSLQGNEYQQASQAQDLSISHNQTIKAEVS